MGFCGGGDGYMVCNNFVNYVIFDSIYFIEVVWKVVMDFYSYSMGFMKGVILNIWFCQNQMINQDWGVGIRFLYSRNVGEDVER